MSIINQLLGLSIFVFIFFLSYLNNNICNNKKNILLSIIILYFLYIILHLVPNFEKKY